MTSAPSLQCIFLYCLLEENASIITFHIAHTSHDFYGSLKPYNREYKGVTCSVVHTVNWHPDAIHTSCLHSTVHYPHSRSEDWTFHLWREVPGGHSWPESLWSWVSQTLQLAWWACSWALPCTASHRWPCQKGPGCWAYPSLFPWTTSAQGKRERKVNDAK